MKDVVVTKQFDQTNPNWSEVPGQNFHFVEAQMTWVAEKVNAKGWVSLNEVYELLDLEQTQEGQTHGWVGEFEASIEAPSAPFDPITVTLEIPGEILTALKEGW